MQPCKHINTACHFDRVHAPWSSLWGTDLCLNVNMCSLHLWLDPNTCRYPSSIKHVILVINKSELQEKDCKSIRFNILTLELE